MINLPRAVLVALLLSSTCGFAAASDRVYYSVTMNEKLIGYAFVETTPVKKDGQDLTVLRSLTSIKVTMLGKPHTIVVESQTLMKPAAGQLMEYRSTIKTNDVKQHIDCEFSPGVVRTWSYNEGDKKGSPVETSLPEGALLLGGNNFGHWRQFTGAAPGRAKNGKASIPAFIPDAKAIESFELTRTGSENLTVLGVLRPCSVWRHAKTGMTFWLDSKANELVRFDIAFEQVTVALADENIVKQAEKSRAEEVLSRHFLQSNVAFDNYRTVTLVRAELDAQLIGTGLESSPSALTTPMQKFEGKIDEGRVKGILTVRSQPYDGKDSPRLPIQAGGHPASATRPELYIESDDPAIVARSAELAKGAANSWDAVLRIARWVHANVSYTIGDTPSARLALEKRSGDCGPHATLTVALLRAAGIPARLVGGLMYASTFGGSFGQHAWVEVYQGPAGWVALDPTTGEYGKISATHIRLFEGLGGVIPRSINVLAYEPPNQTPQASPPKAAKALPWKLKHNYTYRFRQNDKDIGTEVFAVDAVDRDGKPAYELKCDLNLKIAALVVEGKGVMVVGPNGLPKSFHREMNTGGTKYTLDCTFRDGAVDAKLSGVKELQKEIKIPAGAYCFDNNMMTSWAMICSQLDYATGMDLNLSFYHPSSMQIIPITVKTGPVEPIVIDDKKVECYKCDMPAISNTIWVTRDRKLVRAKQANVVIELVE